MKKGFLPEQPFFALSTSKYNKKSAQQASVAYFYEFRRDGRNKEMLVVPDGAIDLVFSCEEDDPTAYVCGPVSNVSQTPFHAKENYFGVRFMPGMLSHFGDASVKDLFDRCYDLREIINDDEIQEKMASSNTLEDRKLIIAQDLSPYYDMVQCNNYTPVMTILDEIFSSNANIRVRDLEKKLNYSRRHLLRNFSDYTGMSIKMFSRTIRFQTALKLLAGSSKKSISEVSSICGYYDQSHFQKEFREFTGMTPAQYINVLNINSESNAVYQPNDERRRA